MQDDLRHLRRAALALAAGALGVLPTAAQATVPSSRTLYEGRTSQDGFTTLEVRPAANRQIQRLAIRYRSACDNGETLRSTFRFAPVALKGERFGRSGRLTGTLTDGRAYTSKVRMTGRFTDSARIVGTFALSTRIPDGKGGVARCTTGRLTWRMAVPVD